MSILKNFEKMEKKTSRLFVRFEERLNLFVQNPFEPSLKTHRLSGDLKELWAISITYQHRLVFNFYRTISFVD